MSKQVSVTEAKRDLTKLLREIEEKQMEIVVTRRGEPYMIIVRYDDYERLSRIRAYLPESCEDFGEAEGLRFEGLRDLRRIPAGA